MPNTEKGKATHVPLTPTIFEESKETREKCPQSLMESLYWQMLGWAHTPPFVKADLTCPVRLHAPSSKETPASSELYFKKGFDPKVQVGDRVPYGYFSRDVVIDLEKRRFAKQDFKMILEEMGITVDVIRPPILRHREKFSFSKSPLDGIPSEPFLPLELFDDDWYYETRSPQEWLSLGLSDDEKKPVPGTALIPVNPYDEGEGILLEWQKVAVLDYDPEKKLFLVRNETDCSEDGKPPVFETSKSSDLWIPRIHLKFEAEEPLRFAKRIRSAITTRHVVEESIRINYYVENIPIEEESLPKWLHKDLEGLIAIARRSCQLRPRLKWIKDELEVNIKEMKLEFKRAINSLSYLDITGQNPNLIAEFQNEKLKNVIEPHKKGHLVKLNYSFKERFESFRCKTLWNQSEAVQALNLVQDEISKVHIMPLFNLSSDDISALDHFETEQRTQLYKAQKYIHGTWLNTIANSILSTMSKCKIGSYDLNQTVQHTFKLTKIGKLLKLMGFKMQDVTRHMVTESLSQFASIFQDACANLSEVKDKFEWREPFSCNKWIPLRNPIFEVGLELKGTHLEFVVDLHKHRDIVVDLFEEALRVTQGLPRLEKLVMKKLLYKPDDKLESVLSSEPQISNWKKKIVTGINRAIIVSVAYARAYNETLKAFKEDQINYVKKLARAKATCDQLKDIIEMHYSEKERLLDVIPLYVDIGPFRLITEGVRTAAVRKHEQLADAVLDHFYDKLRQKMETLNDQFLVLLDRVEQTTGNIEDMLEKKVWCRTVPNKIERLSDDVNVLRADCRLIASFNRNMDDDDFTTYWRIQELPQITMQRLDTRMASFDSEREIHRENLAVDLKQLEANIEHFSREVSSLAELWDTENTTNTATDIRKTRKEITMMGDRAQLLNKREKLFGKEATDFSEIEQLSQKLTPVELFWLNAAEFYKYRERVVSEEISMDPKELHEKILEFQTNLKKSLEHFTEDLNPQIHNSIESVITEMSEFLKSKWVA